VGDKVGNGTCFYIAGRTSLIVGQDTMGDTSAVYCKTLDKIRAYFSSGDIQSKIPEVASINSTIVGDLVPVFCKTVGSTEAAAFGESYKDSGLENDTSFGPGPSTILGAAAGLVALATILFYRKRRNATADVHNFNSNSGSDLEQVNLSPRASEDYSEEIVFSNSSVTDMHSSPCQRSMM
jgi:hypothetical protein